MNLNFDLKGLTQDEKETSISYINSDENVEIYTADPVMWRKFVKDFGDKMTNILVEKIEGQECAVSFSIPASCCLLLRKKPKVVLSDERKEQLKQLSKKMREAKKHE